MSESNNGQAAVLENGAAELGGRTRLVAPSDGGLRAGDLMSVPGGRLMSKVEVYNWEIVDAPGEFMWIPKDKLLVDHAYQRDQINSQRINDIASRWSWVACGTLRVARRIIRSKAHYFIMDGQHTKAAADKRSDIKTLPCMVYDVSDLAAEAAGFVLSNHHRGRMSSCALFKGQVVKGDPNALAVRAMLDDHGYKVGPGLGAKSLACIDAVVRAFKGGEVSCRRAVALCAAVAAGVAMPKRLFEGLYRLDRHLGAIGMGNICAPAYADPIKEAGLEKLLKVMDQRALQVGKASAKACADGVVLKVLNKGRRGRAKLPSLFLSDAGDN